MTATMNQGPVINLVDALSHQPLPTAIDGGLPTTRGTSKGETDSVEVESDDNTPKMTRMKRNPASDTNLLGGVNNTNKRESRKGRRQLRKSGGGSQSLAMNLNTLKRSNTDSNPNLNLAERMEKLKQKQGRLDPDVLLADRAAAGGAFAKKKMLSRSDPNLARLSMEEFNKKSDGDDNERRRRRRRSRSAKRSVLRTRSTGGNVTRANEKELPPLVPYPKNKGPAFGRSSTDTVTYYMKQVADAMETQGPAQSNGSTAMTA